MLVEHIRDGLTEEEHDGYVLTTKLGQASDYPYYLRSCAKPLQASLMIDYELDKKYDLTSEEIALCCASHAGEKCHTDIAKRLLDKFGLKYEWLKCGLHAPLYDKNTKDEITYFHNNCVGKHILFLALCKENGWDIETYDSIDNPLQQKVKDKISDLCEVEQNHNIYPYPITKDGCGVPILAMPLRNMLKGFINLFCDDRYEKIKNAYLENPYIIGGMNRLDTEIIQNSEGLVAKVGAGGLCAVVNVKENDGLIVKINDCNMDTRRLVVFEALNKLGWSDYKCDKTIKTLHNDTVGEIKINLPL
ncbi:MAG: asparaginase [Cyanobacteria bacterium RUI128]|nr:asparaginase [Cyanobacteria bacterium RUI128]